MERAGKGVRGTLQMGVLGSASRSSSKQQQEQQVGENLLRGESGSGGAQGHAVFTPGQRPVVGLAAGG